MVQCPWTGGRLSGGDGLIVRLIFFSQGAGEEV
jgi:hypothetical protein